MGATIPTDIHATANGSEASRLGEAYAATSTAASLPDRASGPDAVSAQMLRSVPPLALTPLLQLFQAMEQKAELPTQMQIQVVVMLPKNQKLERPITLASMLWRVWCRLRKPLLDDWQRQLPNKMNHDKARPGANVLHVALERLLRQEVTKARKRHGITVLMINGHVNFL